MGDLSVDPGIPCNVCQDVVRCLSTCSTYLTSNQTRSSLGSQKMGAKALTAISYHRTLFLVSSEIRRLFEGRLTDGPYQNVSTNLSLNAG